MNNDLGHVSSFLPFLLGIIYKEDGEIRWPVVISGVVTALMVGMGAAVISQGREISAMDARQRLVLERLDKIENGSVAATSDRYRRSDADRDLSALETRIEKRLDKLEKAKP